jgi:hypothetical protein
MRVLIVQRAQHVGVTPADRLRAHATRTPL